MPSPACGTGEVGEQHGVGAVDAQTWFAQLGVAAWRGSPEATAIHSKWRSRTGSLSAPPTRRSASQRPAAPRTSPGPGRLGASARPWRPRDRREGDGVRGGSVDGLGEIGEEGLDGAQGVRDLFRQQLQADDLMGVGRAGRSHLARSRQVPGQPRVDEIRRDASLPRRSLRPDSRTPSSRRRAR